MQSDCKCNKCATAKELPADPTPATIEALTAAIRETWSPEETERRWIGYSAGYSRPDVERYALMAIAAKLAQRREKMRQASV